ncbi:hypothetical protein Tco_0244828, partial [Tanacetum coccineum]
EQHNQQEHLELPAETNNSISRNSIIPNNTNIQYHPGKANVVDDALSRKSGMIACFDSIILSDLERLDVEWKRIFNQKKQKESQKANKFKHRVERAKSKVKPNEETTT